PLSLTLFTYTTLFRSDRGHAVTDAGLHLPNQLERRGRSGGRQSCFGRFTVARWPEEAWPIHTSFPRAEIGRQIGGEAELRRGGRSEEHTSELQSRGHL